MLACQHVIVCTKQHYFFVKNNGQIEMLTSWWCEMKGQRIDKVNALHPESYMHQIARRPILEMLEYFAE